MFLLQQNPLICSDKMPSSSCTAIPIWSPFSTRLNHYHIFVSLAQRVAKCWLTTEMWKKSASTSLILLLILFIFLQLLIKWIPTSSCTPPTESRTAAFWHIDQEWFGCLISRNTAKEGDLVLGSNSGRTTNSRAILKKKKKGKEGLQLSTRWEIQSREWNKQWDLWIKSYKHAFSSYSW